MATTIELEIAEVLVEHQRHGNAACLCGWSILGKSHPDHQAAMLTPVIAEAQATALEDAAGPAEYELDLEAEPKENAPSTWLRARARARAVQVREGTA